MYKLEIYERLVKMTSQMLFPYNFMNFKAKIKRELHQRQAKYLRAVSVIFGSNLHQEFDI